MLQLEAKQEMMRQDHQRHVMMPAAPGARLVLIHAQLSLGLLETRLDGPAQTAEPHQLVAGRARWRVLRYALSSADSPRLRRNTTQSSGPGNFSRTATARTKANCARMGPFSPSLIV